MKILIITTYYAPDTEIGAVRPTMFAKYLANEGHNVTVLRSGMICSSVNENYVKDNRIKVLSYMGENSPAELFEREGLVYKTVSEKSRLRFFPQPVRRVISGFYRKFFYPYFEFRQWKKRGEERFAIQQKILNSLKNEDFDIVFSTYSEMENAYAGEYASKLFGCKWIMDFRDPIANWEFNNNWVFRRKKLLQDKTVEKADICTCVSKGLSETLNINDDYNRIRVLYNGYELIDSDADLFSDIQDKVFRICYTGNIYSHSTVASEALFEAIRKLIESKRMDISKIEFIYAGNGGNIIRSIAKKYGVDCIFEDRGYVSKQETVRIQNMSDVFLVLSWNTKYGKGVLTGKFFEGIRAGKPMLALISGDVPGSELYELNQEYNYGFCYEIQNEEQHIEDLCNFLLTIYNEKIQNGRINFEHSAEFKSKFRYDNLTKELEKLCFDLLS